MVRSGKAGYGKDSMVVERRDHMSAIGGTLIILAAYAVCWVMGYSVGLQHGFQKAQNKRVERR